MWSRISSSCWMSEGWQRNFKPKSRTGIDALQRPFDFEIRIKGYRKNQQTPESGHWRPSPACRQPLQAAQYEGRPPFRILGVVQPQIRQAAQQGRDRDLRLDARQLGAEAKVNASAKRQRTDVRPGDVEPLRPIGIGSRV